MWNTNLCNHAGYTLFYRQTRNCSCCCFGFHQGIWSAAPCSFDEKADRDCRIVLGTWTAFSQEQSGTWGLHTTMTIVRSSIGLWSQHRQDWSSCSVHATQHYLLYDYCSTTAQTITDMRHTPFLYDGPVWWSLRVSMLCFVQSIIPCIDTDQ